MFKDSANRLYFRILGHQEFLLYVVALRLVLQKPPTHVNDRLKQIACAERCILVIQMGEFPATFRSLLKMETVKMNT